MTRKDATGQLTRRETLQGTAFHGRFRLNGRRVSRLLGYSSQGMTEDSARRKLDLVVRANSDAGHTVARVEVLGEPDYGCCEYGRCRERAERTPFLGRRLCAGHLEDAKHRQPDDAMDCLREEILALASIVMERAAVAVLPYARALRAIDDAAEILNNTETARGRPDCEGIPHRVRSKLDLWCDTSSFDEGELVSWAVDEDRPWLPRGAADDDADGDPGRLEALDHLDNVDALLGNTDMRTVDRSWRRRYGVAPDARLMVAAGLGERLRAALIYAGIDDEEEHDGK